MRVYQGETDMLIVLLRDGQPVLGQEPDICAIVA